MPRNIEGPKRNTRLCSEAATETAQAAIRRMQNAAVIVNYRSVAEHKKA
jgi:hypothetical protein